MRRKNALLFGLLAVVLQSCAPAPKIIKFSKPGATYDDYLKDRYACMQEGRTHVSNGFVDNGTGFINGGDVISGSLVISCMAARGYSQDPNGFGPPPGGIVPLR